MWAWFWRFTALTAEKQGYRFSQCEPVCSSLADSGPWGKHQSAWCPGHWWGCSELEISSLRGVKQGLCFRLIRDTRRQGWAAVAPGSSRWMERTANRLCGFGRRMSSAFCGAPGLDVRINMPTSLCLPPAYFPIDQAELEGKGHGDSWELIEKFHVAHLSEKFSEGKNNMEKLPKRMIKNNREAYILHMGTGFTALAGYPCIFLNV